MQAILRSNSFATLVGKSMLTKPSSLAARSIVTFVDSDENPDWALAEFVSYSNSVGQDEYVFYRKTHLTSARKRVMRANKAQGRLSNDKVRSLVKFIQLKQDMKYV